MIPLQNENSQNTLALSQLVGRDIHAQCNPDPVESRQSPVKILQDIDALYHKSQLKNVDVGNDSQQQIKDQISQIHNERISLRIRLLKRLQLEKLIKLTRRIGI